MLLIGYNLNAMMYFKPWNYEDYENLQVRMARRS